MNYKIVDRSTGIRTLKCKPMHNLSSFLSVELGYGMFAVYILKKKERKSCCCCHNNLSLSRRIWSMSLARNLPSLSPYFYFKINFSSCCCVCRRREIKQLLPCLAMNVATVDPRPPPQLSSTQFSSIEALLIFYSRSDCPESVCLSKE